MRAWLFQDHRQKKKLGEKAPWSVGWIDPEGKRRSKRLGSKSMADKFRRKKEGELAAGLCVPERRVKWGEFRSEFEKKVLSRMLPQTRRCVTDALNHFERICRPKLVRSVKEVTIDEYKAARRLERGRKVGDTVSPASLNKELRHLKAVLRKAAAWEY